MKTRGNFVHFLIGKSEIHSEKRNKMNLSLSTMCLLALHTHTDSSHIII